MSVHRHNKHRHRHRHRHRYSHKHSQQQSQQTQSKKDIEYRMDSLKSIVSDIRVFLYGGIRTLPLTIAGTMMVLGLFTANYAMIFFLVGYLIGVPLMASGINVLASYFVELTGVKWFTVKASDVCNIVIPYLTVKNMQESKDEIIVSSTWSAMIAFFFGYIIANATELFSIETTDTTFSVNTTEAPDIVRKKGNRKAQSMIAFFSIIVIACAVIGYRAYSGCESYAAIGITTALFCFIGFNWYLFLGTVGQNRLSDLFGIANRLLPPSAIENAPVACVPIA